MDPSTFQDPQVTKEHYEGILSSVDVDELKERRNVVPEDQSVGSKDVDSM